jgi:hypothetical protein
MPDSSTITDAEKHCMLQDVLVISGGTRERAFQYLEDLRRDTLDPNTPRMGVSALEYSVNG